LGVNRPNPDQFGCFGGSLDSLVLNGWRSHPAFFPWLTLMLVSLGSAGIAGTLIALGRSIRQRNRTVIAVLIAAAIYWVATFPLWLFADRYLIVLLPPLCLGLACAPLPRSHLVVAAGSLMIALLAFVSVGGLVSYHRTMQRVVMQMEDLLRQGIPRKQIDAGYSLNGRDLYVYPAEGMDTAGYEPPIPMITSADNWPYIIATSPLPNTEIWRRFSGCGPLGFGQRPLFVLKANSRSSSP
jgi:hypothetical protein